MRCDNLPHGFNNTQAFTTKENNLKLKVSEPTQPLKKKKTLKDFEFVANDNCHFKTSELGKGAYGTVKKVKDVNTGKIYAMKIMNKKTIMMYSSQDNLKKEVNIHKRILHPHIVRLCNCFEDSQNVYMVMEFAENESLFRYLRTKKQLEEQEAFKFFFQTCLGIDYLHKNNIIHRDLKPENLLLNAENNVKLCDFGWSTDANSNTQSFCGTIDYMAPEMLKGISHDYRIDIWGLGILLYEMLHGSTPFKGRNDVEKSKNIIDNTPVDCNPALSPEVIELIQRILKPNPVDRVSLLEIFNHPWVRKYEKISGININSLIIQNSEPIKEISRLKIPKTKIDKENNGTQSSIETLTSGRRRELEVKPLEALNRNFEVNRGFPLSGLEGRLDIHKELSLTDLPSCARDTKKPIFQLYKNMKKEQVSFHKDSFKPASGGNDQETPQFALHTKKKSVTTDDFMKEENQIVKRIDYPNPNDCTFDTEENQTENSNFFESTISSDKFEQSLTRNSKQETNDNALYTRLLRTDSYLTALKPVQATISDYETYTPTFPLGRSVSAKHIDNVQFNRTYPDNLLQAAARQTSERDTATARQTVERNIESWRPQEHLSRQIKMQERERQRQRSQKPQKDLSFFDRLLKNIGCVMRDNLDTSFDS